MKRIAPLFAMLTLVSGHVVGSEYKPMSGQYAITGPTLMDAPADEKQDRVVLFLEGDAARDVYRGMTAPAKPQVCTPEGAVTKSAGGVTCTFDANDDTYACWIGVRLDSGHAVQVDVPC
jgi:hypothetical protein